MVMDLLPDFRDWAATNGADPYLLEDGHWNEQGHALAARIVAGKLRASALIEDGRPLAEDDSR